MFEKKMIGHRKKNRIRNRALVSLPVAIVWLGMAACASAVSASQETLLKAAAGQAARPEISRVLPDMPDILSLLHRAGSNNLVIASLAAVLNLTSDQKWRCREMYLDPYSEPNVRYTLMVGRDNTEQIIFFEDQIDHYIAISAKTDGTFIAGVAIDTKTGKGVRLNWAAAGPILEAEISDWNAAARSH